MIERQESAAVIFWGRNDGIGTIIAEELDWLKDRALRLLDPGDTHYAFQRGWLDLLVESSQIYTRYNHKNGLPAVFIPLGASAC